MLRCRTAVLAVLAFQLAHAQVPEQERSERELEQQKHQRILGVFPNFNTSYIPDAAALSGRQKFSLAFRSAVDPITFAVAAVDAGGSQVSNRFPAYGQGLKGYAKRFGASYTDSFNGTMLGGAVFPALLHQDPRYFRKGTVVYAPTPVCHLNDRQSEERQRRMDA